MELILDLIILIIKAIAKSGDKKPLEVPPQQLPPPSLLQGMNRARAAALQPWLTQIEARATAAAREQTDSRFSTALDELARAARAGRERLGREGEAAVTEVARLGAMLDGMTDAVGVMVAQRKDRDLAMLLGDSDALAEATYAPLLEYARGQGLPLAYTRAVTVMGDTDLFTLLGPNPARLAPIVLPTAWATEVAWWPAVAHEVGHSFYRGLDGLDAELRRRFALPSGGAVPYGNQLTENDLRQAMGVWLEEIFADAFGVMMLGPAFVRTMIWNFAAPQQKYKVQIGGLNSEERRLDEHPPPHLRVVLGCRLLTEMGYSTDATNLEREWRRIHGELDRFYLPNRANTWLTVGEASLVMRGEALIHALYDDAFASLAGEPLRSIPGLDFGPREHQAAIDVAEQLLGRSSVHTHDPRVLIAGAVLAWTQQPKAALGILRGARAHIAAIGVSLRRRRLREEADEDLVATQGDGDEAELYAEALLLGMILEQPRSARRRN